MNYLITRVDASFIPGVLKPWVHNIQREVASQYGQITLPNIIGHSSNLAVRLVSVSDDDNARTRLGQLYTLQEWTNTLLRIMNAPIPVAYVSWVTEFPGTWRALHCLASS